MCVVYVCVRKWTFDWLVALGRSRLSDGFCRSHDVEWTGALALFLFNASICYASWVSNDIPFALTSLLVSRVGIYSEADEPDFQLMLYLVSRVIQNEYLRLHFLSTLLSGKSTSVD